MLTAIYFKDCPIEGSLTGIITLSLLAVGVADSREPTTPSGRCFETAPQAKDYFFDTQALIWSQGWKLGYLGRPLYG
jgi:hypothetical protein